MDTEKFPEKIYLETDPNHSRAWSYLPIYGGPEYIRYDLYLKLEKANKRLKKLLNKKYDEGYDDAERNFVDGFGGYHG